MTDLTLTTPVTRTSEAKYLVRELCVYARPNESPYATIAVSVQDSSNNEIRYFNAVIPDTAHASATVAGLFTALDTVRASEPAGALARANFRVLGYLLDQGYFPAGTLNP